MKRFPAFSETRVCSGSRPISASHLVFSTPFLSSLQVRKAPEGLTPALDPNDPLADQDQERREVEALARKFESKYVSRSFYAIRSTAVART